MGKGCRTDLTPSQGCGRRAARRRHLPASDSDRDYRFGPVPHVIPTRQRVLGLAILPSLASGREALLLPHPLHEHPPSRPDPQTVRPSISPSHQYQRLVAMEAEAGKEKAFGTRAR